MKATIKKFDHALLGFLKRNNILFARTAIFIVYFWFGILKVFGLSPANSLIESLLETTLPFITFQNFIIIFALFEMLIGVLFLIRGAERLVITLLVLHLIATCLPLILLPQLTWQQFLVPNLEGQYIIKNILIIALAFVVVAQVDYFGEPEANKNLTVKIAKIILALILGACFLSYAQQPQGWIWLILNYFDLLMHEAGHWIFSFFGEFMHVLGGSLNQVLIPAIFTIYFFINKQFYSAALTLFWVGENLIYVSVYVADAVPMQLQLITGGNGWETGFHDWNWLLIYTGQLHHTAQIAATIKNIGILAIVVATIWAIVATLKENSN